MTKPFNSRSDNRKPEHSDDTFVTPDNALEPIINFLKSSKIIKKGISLYDPCSGHGENKDRFYKKMLDMGVELGYYEGNDSREGGIYYDKLNNFYDKKVDLIMANPPYNAKDVFIEMCLRHRSEYNSNLALLMPVATFSGLARYEMFKKFGFPTLVGYNRRPQFVKGGSSNLDVAWFIWSDEVSGNYMLDLKKE
jgi:hypothetical protein